MKVRVKRWRCGAHGPAVRATALRGHMNAHRRLAEQPAVGARHCTKLHPTGAHSVTACDLTAGGGDSWRVVGFRRGYGSPGAWRLSSPLPRWVISTSLVATGSMAMIDQPCRVACAYRQQGRGLVAREVRGEEG